MAELDQAPDVVAALSAEIEATQRELDNASQQVQAAQQAVMIWQQRCLHLGGTLTGLRRAVELLRPAEPLQD